MRQVSESYVSGGNFPMLTRWCWRCYLENTKRTYGKHRTSVSLEQEASLVEVEALIERRRPKRTDERMCWFTGALRGFPHPSTLELRKQTPRRALPQTGDCLHQPLFLDVPQQDAGKGKKKNSLLKIQWMKRSLLNIESTFLENLLRTPAVNLNKATAPENRSLERRMEERFSRSHCDISDLCAKDDRVCVENNQ